MYDGCSYEEVPLCFLKARRAELLRRQGGSSLYNMAWLTVRLARGQWRDTTAKHPEDKDACMPSNVMLVIGQVTGDRRK